MPRALFYRLPLAPLGLVAVGTVMSSFGAVAQLGGVLLVMLGAALTGRWCLSHGASWWRCFSWARTGVPVEEISYRDRLHSRLQTFLIARGAVKPLDGGAPPPELIARIANRMAEARRKDVPRIVGWESESRGPVAIIRLSDGIATGWFERERLTLADTWRVPTVAVERDAPGYVRLVAVIRDPLDDSGTLNESPATSTPPLTAEDFLEGWDD